ncbi:MAG: ABC transporter permease [Alkalispirochaeta sp.]
MRFIGIGAVLLLWWGITALELVPELFVPTPASVLEAFQSLSVAGYRGGTLLEHLSTSMIRLLSGFGLAAITAIPLGIVMGFHRTVRKIVDPLIQLYRPLPPLAYYTLLIVWLGIGEGSKIALLYLAAVPPLLLSAMAGVQSLNQRRIDSAIALGASPRQLMTHVIFPSCLPDIFTGLRVGIGFAYTTLVSAEIVAASQGVGWMVLDASRFLRTDIIFVGIIVMAVTGWILDRSIGLLERWLVPWHGHG